MKDFLFGAWMLILIGVITGLVWWAAFHVASVEHKIAIFGIVAVVVTAITSVLTVTLNNRKAKEREANLLILKEKHRAYSHFYQFFFSALQLTRAKDELESLPDQTSNTAKKEARNKIETLTKKAEHEMLEFKKGLMNWGGEDLIEDFLKYDDYQGEGVGKLLEAGDKLMKALRRDMEFDDKGKVNIMSVILDSAARNELLKKRS